MYTKLWLGNLKERDSLGDLDVNRTIILKQTLKKIRWDSVDWIYLVRDTDKWRIVVNTLISRR